MSEEKKLADSFKQARYDIEEFVKKDKSAVGPKLDKLLANALKQCLKDAKGND